MMEFVVFFDLVQRKERKIISRFLGPDSLSISTYILGKKIELNDWLPLHPFGIRPLFLPPI